MVSNVTAKKPLFPVSFEIFRANVNHTNQEIICKIETSRKIILNFAVSSRSSKLVIWQTHIFLKYYRQMRENKIVANNGSSIVIYTTEDGNTQLEVKLEQDTVWLNREQIAQLYGRDYKTIAKHINNALREELKDEPVVAKFATPKKYGRKEGFTQMEKDIMLKVVVNLINKDNQ